MFYHLKWNTLMKCKGWSKKNLTKVFGPYLSSTSSFRENLVGFLCALSVLSLKMYRTFFLATNLCKILQKQWIARKLSIEPRFTFSSFLFWHHHRFFNITGNLEARNKIRDAVLISMNRAVGKSTSFLLYAIFKLVYCSNYP